MALLPLARLALLAALARHHAVLLHVVEQLAQTLTQRLLILAQAVHCALIALLAAAAVAPGILPLLERLVAQLLLLADHVAEFVQRLIHVAVALSGLRHLQVFQHLLHLVEQRPRGVLVAGARQTLHAVDHVLEILLTHHLGVRIERPRQLLRIVAQLFGKLAHEIVQCRAQIVRQLLDFLVAGAAFQRFLQRLLRGTQRLVDVGDVAVLDRDRERPYVVDGLAHRIAGVGVAKLGCDAAHAEIISKLRRERLGRDHQGFQRDQHQRFLVGIERKIAALLNQRTRQRLHEQPFRQPHVERLAAALVAGFILRRQRQRDISPGIGILTQILHGLTDAVAGPRIRQSKRDRRRVIQRLRRGLIPLCARARRELRLRFGHAVVVLKLVGQ